MSCRLLVTYPTTITRELTVHLRANSAELLNCTPIIQHTHIQMLYRLNRTVSAKKLQKRVGRRQCLKVGIALFNVATLKNLLEFVCPVCYCFLKRDLGVTSFCKCKQKIQMWLNGQNWKIFDIQQVNRIDAFANLNDDKNKKYFSLIRINYLSVHELIGIVC